MGPLQESQAAHRGRTTSSHVRGEPLEHDRPYDPQVSTTVLATKLFAPARGPQLLARPRLTERLVAPALSRRTTETRAALTLIGVVGAFQLALVAGAPWGAATWGGVAPGVLPGPLRVASFVAILVYCGLAALVVTHRLSSQRRRRLLTAASLLMVLGTIGNLATQSSVERLWAPVAAALAVLFWRLRRTP